MEWISVKDGLPEDDGTGMFHSDFVLISDGVGWDMGRLHFDSLAFEDAFDYWSGAWNDCFAVTHWAKVELP